MATKTEPINSGVTMAQTLKFRYRMEFRSITPEEYEPVRQFLAEVGWQHRVTDADKFRRMMEKTDRTVVAWDDSRVIGFGRALCDGVSNGYISMVAVAPDRRGQGIGRALVECLIEDDPNITWVLRAGRGSRGFWKKLGFKASELAMERVRISTQEE
jgi:ribosomal protein S18 acetylase RimI-like enzyme